MGAFGYGGLQSDEGLDFKDKVIDKIASGLRGRVTCGGRSTPKIRAAAELLIRLADCNVHIDEGTLDFAIDQMESIVDCGFPDWADPKQAEQSALEQIRKLSQIRNRGRRRRR